MSGSDSPGPGPGGPGVPCDRLKLRRPLEAPNAEVVSRLSAGDVLDVVMQDGPPIQVLVLDDQERVAGAILPTGQLIECLRDGHRFVAIVISIDGGNVQLDVMPVA